MLQKQNRLYIQVLYHVQILHAREIYIISCEWMYAAGFKQITLFKLSSRK